MNGEFANFISIFLSNHNNKEGNTRISVGQNARNLY